MSNRLSYLEESTVEKHQFEQMESKVFIVINHKNYNFLDCDWLV